MTGIEALRTASRLLRDVAEGTPDLLKLGNFPSDAKLDPDLAAADLIAGKLDQIANLIESTDVRILTVAEGQVYDLASEEGFKAKAQAEVARTRLAQFARELVSI
jgi:hypothetical protein